MNMSAPLPATPLIAAFAPAAEGGWTLSIHILIGVVLLQAWIIYLLFRYIQRLQTRMDEVAQTNAVEEPANALNPLFKKALTGSLDRFSMSEIIQFLNSIRETGILDIVDPHLSEVHRLIMKDGEMVDAFNGDLRGEPAARAILHCRHGHFTFIRGEVPDEERQIHIPAMTLLMESCQEEDERLFDLAQAS